jgi:hypothetical protein
MIYYSVLGTSCFDEAICSLTSAYRLWLKEVVKKSQKTSVNFMTTLKNVSNKVLAYVENALFGSANYAYTA